MRAADWTGRVGASWAAEWRRTDLSFAGLDPALLQAILAAIDGTAAVRPIDIGCGAGATSLAVAAARPDAKVTGLDLSADLVAVAEARRDAAGIDAARCRFAAGDAVAAVGGLSPDLFFSRHGIMFFDDPGLAFARIAAAAAPGARLVFSCFAAVADNPWATEPLGLAPPPALPGDPEPGPFAFADPDRVAAILAAAGWRPAPPERVGFRYVAGRGDDPVAEALAFFRRIGPVARALADADERERPALEARVAAACAARRDGDEVAFPASAWLWSADLAGGRA